MKAITPPVDARLFHVAKFTRYREGDDSSCLGFVFEMMLQDFPHLHGVNVTLR